MFKEMVCGWFNDGDRETYDNFIAAFLLRDARRSAEWYCACGSASLSLRFQLYVNCQGAPAAEK